MTTVERAASRPANVRLASIEDVPLSTERVQAAVMDPRAGGIAVFVGVVRDHDHGRAVAALTYEAHPSASARLAQVAAEVAAAPDVIAVAAQHRAGPLGVGDLAVVAAVSCAHRGDAFEAGRTLIDRIKGEVPIWKWQQFTDGTSEWVACHDGAGHDGAGHDGAGHDGAGQDTDETAP